jgi:hypothetical protein
VFIVIMDAMPDEKLSNCIEDRRKVFPSGDSLFLWNNKLVSE